MRALELIASSWPIAAMVGFMFGSIGVLAIVRGYTKRQRINNEYVLEKTRLEQGTKLIEPRKANQYED